MSSPTRKSVTVFSLPKVDAAANAALVAAGAAIEPFAPEAVTRVLGAAADAPVGILWVDPVGLVARALQEGRDPRPVARAWAGNARAILALHRANRRRLVLVDARLLAPKAPDGLREVLGQRLDLPRPVGKADLPPAPAPLTLAIAQVLLPQMDDLAVLLVELLSASLTPCRDAGAILPDALMAEDGRDDAASAQIAQLIRQVSLQLGQPRRIEALQAERDALAARLAETERKLDDVLRSTSWRITRPMRRVKTRLLRGGASLEAE